MRCTECDHANTEGAWLCINCGAKLPRAELEGDPETAVESSQPEEPSRFAPQISENLRRLRDQTERERGGRRRPRTPARPSASNLLGIPLAAWALIVFLFLIFIVLVSQLQGSVG